MFLPSWWKRSLSINRTRERERSPMARRPSRGLALRLETLESRIAPANWSGDITTNTTWSNTQVQNIVGSVDVESGVTLTIQAGTVVQFNNTTNLTVNGTLLAQGTSGQTIYFTSVNDNSPLGGSDNAGPGNWGAIQLDSDSTGNVLTDTEVNYGGGYGASAAIVDSGAPLTLTNSVVGYSSTAGVRITQANPTLGGDSFQNSLGPAISMDLASEPAITGVSLSKNKINGVELDSGSLPGNETWNNPDIVYWLPGTVTVPQGDTLTVAAGQITKLVRGDTNLIVNGTLSAQGTASQPIVFTSYQDDSHGGNTDNDGSGNNTGGIGDWGSIQFTSTSTGSVLNDVEVLYSGGFGEVAAVIDSGAPLTFDNGVIGNSYTAGLRITQADPTLAGDTFQNSFGPAISMDLASEPAISGVSLSNNNINGVELDSGSLPGNESWNNPDIVYWLPGNVTVPEGDTLTVSAGQVVKVARGDNNLIVNGTLTAQGTASAPIVFTSYRDDTNGGNTDNDSSGNNTGGIGDWGSIQFTSTSTGNVLNDVEVLYGGGNGETAEVYDSGAALTFDNGVIGSSYAVGLQITQANPTLSGDIFQNNNGDPITIDAASNPVISNLTFINNSVNGVVLPSITLAGNTTWNYPGVVLVIDGTVTVPAGVTLTIAPGQIIKSERFFADTLAVNGTLLAEGTLAQPIVFTSIADNSVGGDTDNNPNATPGDGNWNDISFSNTSTGSILKYVIADYGTDSPSGTLGMINVTGAALTVSNSIIENSGHCGIDANTGSTLTLIDDLLVNNSGAGAQGESGATLNVVNCTIDGNLRDVILDSPTANLTNDLITNSHSDGIFQTGATNLTMSFCDVYNPNASNYTGLTDQTGTDGNIEVDPEYLNEPGGQYELHPGSPAEDTGTGTGTPTTDFYGNPRYQDPNLAGRGDGTGTDMGAIWVEQTATSNVDLATTAVSGPATGLEGQQVTVNWTVESVGTGTATGTWHDAVYLSASPVFTPDAILLAEVQYTGGPLGPGQSYNASGTFTLPGVTPGNYYFLVRCNSENEVFEGDNLANNVFASAPAAISLPALTIGTPLNGSLAATGSSEAYQVTTTAGGNLNISLAGASGNANELFVSFGSVPTQETFDADSILPNSANQTVSLANVQAGTYYILVYGANVPSGENFTLTATTPGFLIASVTPTQGSNAGQVTLTIDGAQFDGSSRPDLVDSAGATIQPLSVYYTNPGSISATFELTGLPTGPAKVEVVNSGGATQTLTNGFMISAGQPGQLLTSVVVPSAVRLGREFAVTVNYTNEGQTDMLAPILSLTASSGVELSFSSDLSNPQSSLDLVGVSPTGPAGVLAPGEHGQITVYATSTTAGSPNFVLAVGNYPADPIDWSALSPLLQLASVSNSVWGPLFAQIQQDVGGTWDLYAKTVAADATLLPAGLGLNYSLGDVLSLEVLKAEAQLQPAITGQLFLNDTSHPLGNVALQFYDAADQQYASAVSLTDGTFLAPDVSPGTYTITATGYVMMGTSQATVGSSTVSGVQVLAAPSAELTGSVVLNPGGAPAAGVVVSVVSETGNFATSTTTDSSGLFTLSSLPAGTYDITAGGAPDTQATMTGLTLTAGQVMPNVDLTIAAGGTVSGTVTGPGGPVTGATVSADGADGTGTSTVTAANGTYTLAGLSAQAYTIGATAAGLVGASVGDVNVTAAGAVSDVNLSLTQAGSISGTLTSAVDGSPAPNVVLTLQSGSNTFTAISDSSGNISVPNLPPGTYTISTAAQTAMTTSITATVTAGSNTTISMVVAPEGQVSGTVTNSTTSEPLANVTVYAANQNGVLASTVTDSTGAYSLAPLDAGTYQIIVGDTDSPGVAATTVTLSSSQTTATANFNVAVAGIVSGAVFEADGATPISGAVVALDQGGAQIETTSTDANGNYSFVLVAAGTYQLEAASGGLTFPAITGVALSGGNSVTAQNFTAGSQVLKGVVQDAGSGQPLANATVTILRADAGLTLTQVATLTTASNGSFQITGLVPGSYIVQAEDATHALGQQTVSVTSGSPANVTLNLTAGSTLDGIMLDAGTEQPLANAVVTLTGSGSPALTESALTDANGSYQLASLPPGTYSLVVTASGYEAVVLHQVTVASGTNPLNVAMNAATTLISGTVANGGTPLGNVVVTASDSTGLVVMQATTASDGAYQLSGLPPGTYQLVASAAGYTASAPLSRTLTAGQTISNVNFAVNAVSLSDPPASPADSIPNFFWVTVIDNGPPDNTTPDKLALPSPPPDPTEIQLYGAAVSAIDAANDAYATLSSDSVAILFGDPVASVASLEPTMLTQLGGLESLPLHLVAVNGGQTSNKLGLYDVENDLFAAIDTIATGDFPTATKALSKLVSDLTLMLQADVVIVTIEASKGQPNPSDSAALALVKQFLANTLALRQNVAALQAYFTALSDYMKAQQAAQQAVDAYLASFKQTVASGDGGTLTTVYGSVGTVVFGAPIVQLPSPGDLLPTQLFNPVPGQPNGPPEAAPGDDDGGDESVTVEEAFDPNNLTGPAGFGSQNFIQPETLAYRVDFENKPTATAAAQVVTATLALDPNANPSTFQFTSFGFGQFNFTVPAGLYYYQITIDLRPDGIDLLVPVTLDENPTTGVVTVEFQSLDPATMEPPDGINDGFLAIDDAAGDGEGYFTYTVQPKAGLGTGTTISEQASITFDTNASLSTPTAVNTIDTGANLTSSVTALPATSPTNFMVSWSGTDTGGSGIAFYNTYVSQNNGPYTLFTQAPASQTSATFTGTVGDTYRFYSVATDNVGNVQPPPSAAQASTTAASILPTSSVATLPADSPATFTLTWSGSDPGGPGIATYTLYVSKDGGGFTPYLSKTTQTSTTFTGQNGQTYGFYTVATDDFGNMQPTPTAAQATTTVETHADHVVLEVPTQAVAGGTFSVTAIAANSGGTADPTFTGNVALEVSGGPKGGTRSGVTLLPFVNGVATFNGLSLKPAGSYTLFAASTGDLVAATAILNVVPAPVFRVVLAPVTAGNTGSGQSFQVDIIALLANMPDTGYLGTVQLTSSDPQATGLAPVTFTASDDGIATETITLKTLGKQTVTATDTSLASSRGTSNAVTVTGSFQQQIDHFLITGLPASVVAGVTQKLTITAVNAGGQTVTGYTGTVQLTSSDPLFPKGLSVTFALSNKGVQHATVVLSTPGTQSLNATDASGNSGKLSSINVVESSTRLGISTSTTKITAGGTVMLTVVGLNSAHAMDPFFADELLVTTSDRDAQVVQQPTAAGVETFKITFTTAGTQTITVSDLTRPALTGPVQSVSVSPAMAAAAQVDVTGFPLFAVAGTAPISVTAEDQYGNRITSGFTDTVTLAGQTYKFQAKDKGAHVFMVPLTAGAQSLTATDTTNSGVQSGPAANITVLATSARVAGTGGAVAMVNDPTANGEQALIIIAPASGGNIVIAATSLDGKSVAVIINNQFAPGSFTPTGHIFVYGQGGKLVVTEGVGAPIAIPAIMLGGSGTNMLSVANSSVGNLLVGGSGKDTLIGGSGHDILIAGGGSGDVLTAGGGGSLLINGSTLFDAKLAALAALLDEWSSGDSYTTRVQDLFGNGPAGANGSTYLDPQTVFGDPANNQLIGGSSDADWIWLTLRDKMSNYQSGEVATLD